MNYRNFQLWLRSDPQGNLRTDLVDSPFGVAEAPFILPFANGVAERLLERTLRDAPRREAGTAAAAERQLQTAGPVQDADSELPTPQEVGRTLFAALLTGEVAKRYAQARAGAQASKGKEGLRILLSYNANDPHLAPVIALPWELLAEPDGGEFLAQALGSPVSRYPLIEGPPLRPRFGPALRILVVRSAPANLPALDLEGELRQIWASRTRPEIEIAVLDHPSLAELRRRLREEPWQILHFMGHGGFDAATGDGVLCFETADGRSEPIPASLLGPHLRDTGDLRLVVLNACSTGAVPHRAGQTPYTALPPALLRAGVPAVLAMRVPVSDRGAVAFSATFYERLAGGDRIDAAVVEGRLALLREDPRSQEWATPILYIRVPDGDVLGGLPPVAQAGVPPANPAPSPPWQEEPRRLGLRSFKDTGDSLIDGQEMEREGAKVLDLRPHFKGQDGRRIGRPSWWQSRIFPELRGFLAEFAAERRPLHLNFAAHATIAFAAGYCLNVKSGLDITIRQRGKKGGDWHPETGVVPKGPLFKDEPDLPRDPAARDVAFAVGITHSVVEDVELYLGRENIAVRRILPVTLAAGPGQAGVRDGLHALALAEDLAAKIRRRTVHEHEGVLHLFLSAPNALLFFLGQLARDFGPIQLYEHEFGAQKRGAYLPSLRLPVKKAVEAD
jgi:hypothetical protein